VHVMELVYVQRHAVLRFSGVTASLLRQTFQRSGDRINGILGRIVGRYDIDRSTLQFQSKDRGTFRIVRPALR